MEAIQGATQTTQDKEQEEEEDYEAIPFDHRFKEPLRNCKFDMKAIKIETKDYYPFGALQEINVHNDMIKKHANFSDLKAFLFGCNEAGLITRQEIVSMLPPLLCDI